MDKCNLCSEARRGYVQTFNSKTARNEWVRCSCNPGNEVACNSCSLCIERAKARQ